MLMSLLIGLPITLLCLLLQAAVVAFSLRRYVHIRRQLERMTLSIDIQLLALVLLLMLLGNFLQMAIWAGLFVWLGEFDSFAQALYFSGVTFSTLGYGDVVLSEHWQLLSPLEAANGILMFGVSTAVMTAAVSDSIKRYAQQLKKRPLN